MVAYIIFIVFIIFIVRYILSLTTPFSSAISFGIKEKERIALRNILSLSKISLERFNQLCNVNVGFKNISAKLKIVGIPMPGLDDYLDVNNTNGTVLIRRNKTIINIESGGNQCFSGDLILTFPQDTGINYNFSKAISFDGVDDYVEVPNSFLLNPNSTVTVEAWIYPISYGGGGLGRVVSKETGIKANPYALELRNTSAPYLNGVIFCVGNGASETCTDTGCNNIITLNTWQHVAGRYNTTHLSVFVNGVEKCNRALSSYNFQQPNTSLLIGNNPDNTRQFKGIIDEVRIYNRALSEDEIRAHYNNGIGNYGSTESGLVAGWHFDESGGTSVIDYSGNGNHGNLKKGAMRVDSVVSQGKKQIIGNALSFDGVDDYVNILNSPTLNITNEITIEAWIYPISIGSYSTILSKGTSAGDYSYFLAVGTMYNNSLSFQLGNVGEIQTGNRTIQVGVWQHVVGTRSGNIMRTYVNGQLSYEKTDATGGLVRTNNFPVKLGVYETSGFFNGTIDEVRIYNRALSEDEIRAHYNNGIGNYGSTESGLVAGWHFDESGGTSVIDYSGNGNHGLLINGPTRVDGKVLKGSVSLNTDFYQNKLVNISLNFGCGSYEKFEIPITFIDKCIFNLETDEALFKKLYIGTTKSYYECGRESLGSYSYNELFTNFESNGTSFISLLTAKIWW